jgi:hypothetical protein
LNLNVLIVYYVVSLCCTDVINTCKSDTTSLALQGVLICLCSIMFIIFLCHFLYRCVPMLKKKLRRQGYNNLEGVVNAGEGDGVRNP